jgi:hypothetical protein
MGFEKKVGDMICRQLLIQVHESSKVHIIINSRTEGLQFTIPFLTVFTFCLFFFSVVAAQLVTKRILRLT